MMDINRILKTLPHRYPFLLVDRILEMEPGKRAVGIKNVTINEPFFQGHWPEMPVMPGVLILEAMCQVGGVLLLAQADNEGKQAYIGGLDKVRFRRRVLPGDQLLIEVEILKTKGDIGRVHATAKVNGELATEGEFVFALSPITE
ncbi:MAG: 3-hydroxyacyl-ACP dehydratase FabZ [Armatimonadetes bacterium]|nr:3-hydroxyacyl-ACP dehydratase FabZ [Armatimonadota bacterium]